ncbi:hypothetical protein VY88_26980 [Azospirillum thiophilum]|uniref:Phage gp6-like head-tail connector protein n=1 Tax=Azospirillum thiophilum TaxID=528244 RepID=A0AAC8W4R7_9PROT|nr:head-tail connector protein [Azospirillum thiophilum]ALG75154.1 hypothetical protein AL072_29885 [Azospirillum thiophilum]KJR62548.1 hypothetical protein VY88_26980 [Azospirillum thiophilum]
MGLKLITPPAAEPVSLAEQKLHMRVDGADEDTLIEAQIVAARMLCESHLCAAIVTQVWEWTLDGFLHRLEIPHGPVMSVDSVSYVDSAGVSRTLDPAAYQVDVTERPALILPAPGAAWPRTRAQLAAVTVRFTLGFGDAAEVPGNIKSAVMLLAAHLYANREPINIGNIVNELPFTVAALLSADRQWGVGS